MADLNARISRRQVLKLLGIGAGMAVLGACAPKQAGPAAPGSGEGQAGKHEVNPLYEEGQKSYGWYDEKRAGKKVSILIWGYPGDETDPLLRTLKGTLERYRKLYPEVEINYEPVPWDDLDTKVNAAFAAKQGPDVLFEADREGEYPRRGAIREIPEEVLPADYIKSHKFYEVRPLDDGKLYWVHYCAMGPIMFANRELLAKEGLKPADTPTSWEEFGKFCQQLTKVENGQMVQAGFAFNGYARYIWDDMMYQQKAHVYDKKKSFINTPESANAWQMLVDMYDRFKVNDRAFLNFDEALGTGKAAFAQVWTWFGAALEGNYPEIDWAPVMYPTFTGKGPYGRFDYDGPCWMVTALAEGDKMLAAWELFKFHVHDYQFLVEKAHTSGTVVTTDPHPDYNKLFDEVAAIDKPSQEQRRMQSLAVLSKEFEGGMVFPGEVAAPFDGMWAKMQDAILLDQRPIKDVLAEYEKLYDEMLSQTNFWITPEA